MRAGEYLKNFSVGRPGVFLHQEREVCDNLSNNKLWSIS